MTLLEEIAFSQTLIDCGVPEREADEITDCITADRVLESSEARDDVYPSIVASVSCWTARPENVLRCALTAAEEVA